MFILPTILFISAIFCFIMLIVILSSDYRERNIHHDSRNDSYYQISQRKEYNEEI